MIFILITVIKTCCKTVTTVTKRMSGCHFVPNIPQKAIFRQFQKGFLHNILLRTQTMYENLSRIFIFNPQTLKSFFSNQLVTKIFHWTLWELQRSHLGWLENDPVKLHLLLHSLVTEAWKPSQFDTLHKRTRCTIFKIEAWLSMPRCSPWKPIKNKFN